jgi:ABC-type polysaccharide/polyol phosphate export permease
LILKQPKSQAVAVKAQDLVPWHSSKTEIALSPLARYSAPSGLGAPKTKKPMSKPAILSNSNRYPKSSLADAVASLRAWRLWLVLGYREVNAQYQRAWIGPFWLTVHAAVWIAATTFIFSMVITTPQDVGRYCAHVAIGIVMFNLITNIVTGGSEVFIKSRIMIHSHPNPLLIHPLRLAAASAYQFALQLPAVAGVFLIFGTTLTHNAWMALVGLLVNLAMAGNIALLFALAGARFGDFRFVTLSGMRLALFITPIFWSRAQVSEANQWVLDLNPFAHFIAIVRDPLLGSYAPMLSWIHTGAWFMICLTIGGIWFVRTRRSIAMWV